MPMLLLYALLMSLLMRYGCRFCRHTPYYAGFQATITVVIDITPHAYCYYDYAIDTPH